VEDNISFTEHVSVIVVTELWAGRLGFDSWQGQEFFSVCHCIQTGSGSHPASYPMGTLGSFPQGFSHGMKATAFLQLVPRLRMHGAISPHPHYIFTVW